MRDPNRVDRFGKGVSAREDDPRDLTCGTYDAKKDGYSVVARRPRSRYDTEMVAPGVADSYESPNMGIPFYDD